MRVRPWRIGGGCARGDGAHRRRRTVAAQHRVGVTPGRPRGRLAARIAFRRARPGRVAVDDVVSPGRRDRHEPASVAPGRRRGAHARHPIVSRWRERRSNCSEAPSRASTSMGCRLYITRGRGQPTAVRGRLRDAAHRRGAHPQRQTGDSSRRPGEAAARIRAAGGDAHAISASIARPRLPPAW